MASYETIAVEQRYDGRVVDVVMGPPPGNILTARMMDEIDDAIGRIGPAVCAVVFRGQGKHFSFGASVEEHRPGAVDDMLPRMHAFLARVIDCGAPTIAQVSGMCLGGGFELALACALVFADGTAQFGVPEIQLGVFPPAASVLLPLKTGEAAALEAVLTGARFGADDMLRMGAVNRAVATGSLDAEVAAFVEKHLLPKSASSLRLASRAARAATLAAYRERIAVVERMYLEELMKTADAVEGIEAFLEKRDPQWKHA